MDVESGVDLLILGTKGYGFLERLTARSISFRQVMKPYPILVLRVLR